MSKRMRELEAQLAQLEWRKLQNARRINEILGTIKRQQHDDSKASAESSAAASSEYSRWLKQIEEEENSKPLRLPRDTIKRLREEKAAQKERARKRQEQHQLCLRNGERSIMSTSSGALQVETLHKLRAIRERISTSSGPSTTTAAAAATSSMNHTL